MRDECEGHQQLLMDIALFVIIIIVKACDPTRNGRLQDGIHSESEPQL